MIKVALVGCAHIHTPNFVKRLQARDDVEVKTVWDHDSQRAHQRAGELRANVVHAANEIWADPEVEAAIICSETNRHAELVTDAARARKHLFVEKPLGMGATDAYAMADAIERAGVLFQTGYFMRGNPNYRFLREEIGRGAFGRLTRMRVSNGHAGALRGWFDTEWRWMTDPEVSGLGGFGDLGTHALDLLLWLLGEPRQVHSVTASVHSATRRYGDVDEYGEGMMRLNEGLIGTISAGWVDVADPVQLQISGTRAQATVVNQKLYYKNEDLEGADGAQSWTELPDALPHAFELFLDAVTGQADVPLVSPREAALRSSVMEALYEAADSGEWVAPKTSAALTN